MNPYPTTLVCTVGTSLFQPNLKTLDPEKKYMLEPEKWDGMGNADKKVLEKAGLWEDKPMLKTLLKNIKANFEAKRWTDLAGHLTTVPPDLRLCGAEINSIEAMIRKKFLPKNPQRLVLLVSDTPDGRALGEILSAYFLHGRCPIPFRECRFRIVEGLQDEKPLVFQREGLTNLVRLLGDELRKWGEDWMAVNATGGYKAQIALAVAFGQATRCPVFYKHERFDQIIRFPRIPFTIDLEPVGRNLKLWADLAEPGVLFEMTEMDDRLASKGLRESILPMLDTIMEAGDRYVALSALGQVYWEAFLTLHPEASLEPKPVGARKGCNFRDDHYPKGFKAHVEKVYDAFPKIISECHSVDYSGQRGMNKNRFYERTGRIFGEYVDRDGFGGRFEIMTTAENPLERRWILKKMNAWVEGRS